ncbi:MAG: hypothetical protein RIS85_1699 [Pseudomonadota bacterium]|jgi:hypothetical protein
MIRSCLTAALASALIFHLGGCQKGPATASTEEAMAEATFATVEPTPRPSAAIADVVEPGKPSYATDPAEALDAFASAIEARDWTAVRAFWGDNGARSGMDEAAFAAKWSNLMAPQVTISPGQQEGAAGSLFYTAPVTIVDGKRTIRGDVVIRRVNGVDGATPEQLRWHIESTTLAV